MGLLELVLLGIVQGLTEFLPISSDGHLALAQRLFGAESPSLAITVALHAGTLAAVVVYFRGDLARIVRSLPAVLARKAPVADRRLAWAIAVGSVPTAILGLALKGPTAVMSEDLLAIAACLSVSGLWNGIVVLRARGMPAAGATGASGTRGAETLSAADALAIGAVQGLAVLPGLSRSASTIGMGVALGLSRDVAARFSFLLSLPAVAGALLLEAKDLSGLPAEAIVPVAVGVAVSFAVGMLALRLLFAVLRRGRFDLFAYYCFALAAFLAWRAT